MKAQPVNAHRDEVSLGALTLILCLALPVGVLSLFAPRSTADEVDAADSILLARVAALQMARDSGRTTLRFEVEHPVMGVVTEPRFVLQVDGRPDVEVGDLVLALISFDPPTLHGTYQVLKDPRTAEYRVLTPVTGLSAEGVLDVTDQPLAWVEDGMRRRRGLGARERRSAGSPDDAEDGRPRSGSANDPRSGPGSGSGSGRGAPASSWRGGAGFGDGLGAGTGGDDHGNDIASATPVILDPPHPITGMPTTITGLLTPGDVDYFSFDARGLSLLHAETRMPSGLTSMPDTIIGLFDATTGQLLAFDDDSGDGKFSRLLTPLETTTSYAIAVEGAPDQNLDFTGDDGVQTGAYELALELEQPSYIGNQVDLLMGVSIDGTFIEDLVGFKRIDGLDVLRTGVEADGWGLAYDVRLDGGGFQPMWGGSGDFLVDPAFVDAVDPVRFSIGPVGNNPTGRATASTALRFKQPGMGMTVELDALIETAQSTLEGTISLVVTSDKRIHDIVFTRLLDPDLFGVGADTFYWSYRPGCEWAVYPTGLDARLEDPQEPATASGSITADQQVAMVLRAGPVGGGTTLTRETFRFPMAFTLIDDFVSEQDAVQSAIQNLRAVDAETWTIAVDRDPDTGLHTAFGVGLGKRLP